MTASRDELIEQASRDVGAAIRETGGLATDIQALVDAGWRPPPTDDVAPLGEIASACRDFLTVWNDQHAEPAHFGPAVAVLAGLLATPVQQDTENPRVRTWLDDTHSECGHRNGDHWFKNGLMTRCPPGEVSDD